MFQVHRQRIQRIFRAGIQLGGLFALLLVGLAVVTPAQVSSQPEACTPIVTEVLTRLENVCSRLSRNTACYGNNRVNAVFTRAGLEPTFAVPDDRVSLSDLLGLRTLPLDPVTGEWGIAVLSVQANLPDALPGQNVIFMVMGDAGIALDRTAPPTAPPMQMLRLRTDFGAVTCEEAPRSLVLAQGPRGVTVDLTINGLDVSFGSTIALYQNNRNTFWIATIDGTVLVEGTVPVPPGQGALIDMYLAGDDQRVLDVRPLTDEERGLLDPLINLPPSLLNYPVAWDDLLTITPTVLPATTPTIAPGVDAAAVPVVNVTADATTLTAGSCTFIRWHTANIDSIFYNGSPTVGTSERQECPTRTTTYTITVQFRDGTRRNYPITLTVTGAPIAAPTIPPPPPTIAFFTVDDSDPSVGTCTFLRWEVTNSFSVRLDGLDVAAAGALEICPTAATTYLLEALGSTTVTATVSVGGDDDD